MRGVIKQNNSFNPCWLVLRRNYCGGERLGKAVGFERGRAYSSSAVGLNISLSLPPDEQDFHVPTFTLGPPAPAPKSPVQIRGRVGLPDASNPNLPEALGHATATFPLPLDAEDVPTGEEADIEAYAIAARDELDTRLPEVGAVLLRNLPLSTHEDFSDFVRGMGYRTSHLGNYLKFMHGRSMTSTQLNDVVRTSSDEPPSYTIEPHNEYHTAGFPHKIILWCQEPPAEGGEWPLSDGRAIYKALDKDVVKKLEELQVRYKVFYPSEGTDAHVYNSWQQNIGATTEAVENYLKGLNYEWEWHDDGAITYWANFPVTVPHPKTGEMVWFNQVHAQHKSFYASHPAFAGKEDCGENPRIGDWPVHDTYGDGTALEEDVIAHIREVVWRNTVAVPMHAGDMLVCDNHLSLHGRMSFPEGVSRKVFVSATYE